MKRKPVSNQAASYLLAGLLLSMLVAFVAFDLNAVDPGHASSTVRGVPGILIASAQ
jgi:hypothetical protein